MAICFVRWQDGAVACYAMGAGRARPGRIVQIKKSRRCRYDKAGSSNKEWLYKQKLYSKD
jgi:hypothetical protein